MNRGYIRVSSARQQEGLSLSAQKAAIRAVKDGDIKFYQDVGSGRNGNRKQLKKMMKDLQRGDKVIVFRLDRISRSTIDLANLIKTFEKKEISFISAKENINIGTASGKLFVGMLGLFAEFESNLISERTLAANGEARKKHKWLGGNIPYGWSRKQGHLSPVESEQKVIRKMSRMREKEKLSYDKISQRLSNDLIPTKQNCGRWYPDNINHILRRNRELEELLKAEG